MSWFAVDKKGLASVMARHGRAFVIHELLQNAWDEQITRVDVTLDPLPGKRGLCRLVVEDDSPDGFSDLTHAYTLFAPSKKKDDASKRGVFNLGEKLVLALCKSARVTSTKGSVIFRENGERTAGRKCRDAGTVFEAEITMTQAEYEEVCKAVDRLLVPSGIVTTFNGLRLQAREPVTTLVATLPTVVADEEGNLKRTARKTIVRVYEPCNGDEAAIYELGIPVVTTGDRFHVDVQQKVPVNMERNSVPPGFLQALRVHVANATADLWTADDATSKWVQAATADERCEKEAFEKMAVLRFGEKRAAFDPSDPEANQRLVAKGYTVVPGGTFNRDQWGNARRYDAVLPSGRLSPTPKPYGPNGVPEKVIDPSEWTPDMAAVVELAIILAGKLMGLGIAVRIVREPCVWWEANYGGRSLCLNYSKLGKKWFTEDSLARQLDLLVHEFAHESESSHLSDKYHRACCQLAGDLAVLALRQPELFNRKQGRQ